MRISSYPYNSSSLDITPCSLNNNMTGPYSPNKTQTNISLFIEQTNQQVFGKACVAQTSQEK